MSIRPEPSVVGARGRAQRSHRRRLRARHRQRLQVGERKQHRVLVALTGQVVDAATVVAGHGRAATDAARRRPARLARRGGMHAAEPNRSPPEAGADAAGAAKTSASPPPSPNSGRLAPERRRPPLRSLLPLVGCDGAVRSEHVADVDRAAVDRRRGRRTRGRRRSSASRRSPPSRCTCRPRISPRSIARRGRQPPESGRPARLRRRCASRRFGGGRCAPLLRLPVSPPRTTMMWLHFLQRILKTLPRTLSSEIEYLVPQESQMIFINASIWRFAPGRRRERTAACRKGTAHYIEAAAACKRRRRRFPRNFAA